ncbi:CDK5 regulatory subunit-associated protein 2 isoform X2 [Sphaerodactylus townsendi]|uniref:CDK5 regulatory subunit-associated protein 2 isoform X2 n=1 Tax=Sphaerodactylus townsendi TaxID=933632 RepID=UPI002026DAA3|nr:CDK5 regulatory subunit-associated protein 2 isoform X2 [Sphaerodactylus townsendi]
MDSFPGEDPTLPVEFNGSVNISRLPDVSGDEIRIPLGGGGALPDVAEDAVSPTRVRTMKDFENQIIELRKENFNLKLRIYFLEERIQQKFDGPSEEIYRMNIELKIELESLKRELQERERLLIKASKAVESLAQGGDAEIQHVQEEAHKKVQQVEEHLTSRMNLLEEDLKTAHEELEKAFAATKRERALRMAADRQLSLLTNIPPKDLDMMAALEEKDRCIEQLRLLLKNKEALIQHLEEAKSSGGFSEENLSAEKTQDLMDEKEQEFETLRTKHQNEQNELEKRIQSLQEELQERQRELSVERRNALKRDKTIQGLTVALKAKDGENKELNYKLESLNASLVKTREVTHEAQMQTFQGTEDYQALLTEKENLLVELHSEIRTKDMENHQLQQRIERTDQELTDLQVEKERLVKELEEAQLPKSRSDKPVGELDGMIKGKDGEFQEPLERPQSLLDDHVILQRENEASAKEKRAVESPHAMIKMFQGFEHAKESEYAGVIEALRKERDVFSNLIKSLKDAEGINNLQAELNNISLLRRQLEDDILANWNLRKELEEQIKANKGEEETLFSWGDQTSYMSICLGEQDPWNLRIDQLSVEELKKKIMELLLMLKELHLVNQDLRQRHPDGSRLDSVAKETLQTFDESEFLKITEDGKSETEAYDEDMNTVSFQNPEEESKVIPLDSSDRQSWNSSKLGSESDPAADDCFGAGKTGKHEAQESSSLMSLSNENGAVVLDSRQEHMKSANKLLDHLSPTEQDRWSEDLENKDEKDLKQLIIQLRAEPQLCTEVNKFVKQLEELKSALEEKALLDPTPELGMNANIGFSKAELKDSATQTMVVEGKGMGLKHEGSIVSSEDKGKSSQLNRKWEQWQETAALNRTNKGVSNYPAKKSRLPVLLKSSRSLGNIPLSTHTKKQDMHLQYRILTLDEDLKDKCDQPESLHDESQLSEAANGRPEQEGAFVGAESLTQLDCSDASISLVSGDSKEEMSQDQSKGQETEDAVPEPYHPAAKVQNQEVSFLDKPDVDSSTTYSSSKSLLSLKLSITSTEAFDVDSTDDVEELRQRVKDLKSDLAKYRTLLLYLQPAMQLLPGDIRGIVQGVGELPMDSHFLPVLDIGKQEAEMLSGSHRQIDYQSNIENLTSRATENQNEVTVERLMDNEAELEKEQIANMHLLDEVYCLQYKLNDISPLRHDTLILSLQHEHSSQPQKIQDSHSVCETYRQHLASLIKAFEELLQASEVDHCVAEGFREQLSQSVQLFERLEQQCVYGESIDDEMSELRRVTRSFSNFETAENSPEHNTEGVARVKEPQAGVPAKFPPELLMEHLQEIRMLRHQLEESIKTNDRLRKQLEQQVADSAPDQGSANICIHGSEHHNSLTSEIHFLRKQNQLLNVMLAKGSRDKQKENEKLRESLSKKHVIVERLHKDYEHVKKENEKLQKQVGKREEENGQLTHEVYNIRNELNRLQTELNAKQHQQLENEKLLQSLQLELKVYEKLDETIRSRKDLGRDGSDECRKDQNGPLDLHELLTEIRDLRTQLEGSIQANRALHVKLEEQLSRGRREKAGSGSTVNINYLLKQELQHYTGINEFKFPAADSNVLDLQQKYGCSTSPVKAEAELSLDDSDGSSQFSSQSCEPGIVPGHCVWADKNGRHILGLVENYNSLRKQISGTGKLLSELDLPLKAAEHQERGVKVACQASLDRHSAAICAARCNLEEAAHLLKLFWRISLPMKVVHKTAYSLQDESMKAELHQLRRKLATQEKTLHSTMMHLRLTNQLKENMEKVIINQLALTHDVLKKARGNLQVQPENKISNSCFSTNKVL